MVKLLSPTWALIRALFCGVLLVAGLCAARAQSPATEGATPAPAAGPPSALPEAPSQPQASGSLSGTVLDPGGSVVQGATVTLTSGGHPVAVTQSGGNGQFTFTGLPAGTFRVTASGKGMGTAHSSPIALPAGGVRSIEPLVVPLLGATTSIRVTADQTAIAEQDVHIEESQRVLGILPNFYTAFDWNSPPLNSRQKFQLAWRSFIDPTTFLEAGAIAGAEQYENLYPGFGTGATGYGKRYGAALANTFDSRLFGEALFPALFRQDPRYFYKGRGSTTSRALYAIQESFMTRGHDGRQEINYSRILANFAAGGMSNLYYPEQNRGAALVFENGAIELGGGAFSNLLREFVLPNLTQRGLHFTAHKPWGPPPGP